MISLFFLLLSLSLSPSVFLAGSWLDLSLSRRWIESLSRVNSGRSCVSGWLPAAAAVNQYPHCACHLSFSLPCPASITLCSSLSFSLYFSLALHEPSVALRSSHPFSLAVAFPLCLFLSYSLAFLYLLFFIFSLTLFHFLSFFCFFIFSPLLSLSLSLFSPLSLSFFSSLFLTLFIFFTSYSFFIIILSFFPIPQSFFMFSSMW